MASGYEALDASGMFDRDGTSVKTLKNVDGQHGADWLKLINIKYLLYLSASFRHVTVGCIRAGRG